MRPLTVSAALIAVIGGSLAGTPAATGSAPVDGAVVDAARGNAITLITGDRVRLTGGEVTVEEAAPRPGGAPEFTTRAEPRGVYLFPSDAWPAIRSGQLDRELFNVSYLTENGYADAASDHLPVIVQYPPVGTRSALPVNGATLELPSIDGAAVQVPKSQATGFWSTIAGGVGTLRSGVAKIWLDRKATATLDVSVPLIGAPQAWAAGYDGTGTTVAVLDTGIDAQHPDVTGRIGATRAFVGNGSVADGNGHGTHVASTVAGGKGVAPGARLAVGKVLDDSGNGPFSAIIAGMEWAASEADADIVSMSLGAGPTDGTDILSQAVDNLSAREDVLFVIAAGNSGPDPETVATPGAATSALTVGATDKSDALAAFSSRGPRAGDLALKPDLTAPGVGIVAARAAGTSLGNPVDDRYTAASGTSMATPHVAGAAALLAQQHPAWTANQLKATLMSTTKELGNTVYQRGSGRLDVARAVRQQVVATTPNLDFATVSPTQEPISKQVGYSNPTGQPVTLTLTAALTRADGTATPAGSLTADASVTVPAGGTATGTVTLKPVGLDRGWYSGAVVATDAATGFRLSTPVGLALEPPKVKLTIRTLGPDGQPKQPEPGTEVLDLDGTAGWIDEGVETAPGVTVFRVPAGRYSIGQRVRWVAADNRSNDTLMLEPQATVAGDTEIVLDALRGKPVSFSTPEPAGPLYNSGRVGYQRTTKAGERYAVVTDVGHAARTVAWARLWVTPTARVTTGGFRFWNQWLLGRSELTLTTRESKPVDLHPATHRVFRPLDQIFDFPGFVPFSGTHDLSFVDAGRGLPADLAGRDLHGKLALMEADHVNGQCGAWIDRIKNIREAGAAGVLTFPPAGSGCPIPFDLWQPPFTGPRQPVGIPFAYLPSIEGMALRTRLASRPVTVRAVGTPETPYTYMLKPYHEGRVPDSLHYRLDQEDLARVDLDFHAPQTGAWFNEQQSIWQTDDLVGTGASMSWGGPSYRGPRSRREYIGPLNPRAVFVRSVSVYPTFPREQAVWSGDRQSAAVVLDRPFRTRQPWNSGPITPGSVLHSPAAYALPDPAKFPAEQRGLAADCALCRQGDTLIPVFPMVEGAGHAQQGFTSKDETHWRFDYHLSKDGTEIPVRMVSGILATFPMPKEPGRYRLTASGPRTDVDWTFSSVAPVTDTRQPGYECFGDRTNVATGPCRPEPVVLVSYDLGRSLSMDNVVPAGGQHEFEVHAYHQPSRQPMPRISGLELWLSTDDGATWQPVPVRSSGDGRYEVKTRYPNRDATVSLKVEAWDVAGNRITQVTKQAFQVGARR